MCSLDLMFAMDVESHVRAMIIDRYFKHYYECDLLDLMFVMDVESVRIRYR